MSIPLPLSVTQYLNFTYYNLPYQVSREVADEEDDDDGAEHQGLPVLISSVLSVSGRSDRTCNKKYVYLMYNYYFLITVIIIYLLLNILSAYIYFQ